MPQKPTCCWPCCSLHAYLVPISACAGLHVGPAAAMTLPIAGKSTLTHLCARAQELHFHGVAADLSAWLPTGLAGGVGMIRNWTFTLFYCMSELWGDVVLSLLFWGLANETTALKDASLLYPLFGIGANVGQVRSYSARLRLVHTFTQGQRGQMSMHTYCIDFCGSERVQS